jgi:hypothetical protein
VKLKNVAGTVFLLFFFFLFYPSVFCLVGSFPSVFVASRYFNFCITVSFCVSGDLL